VRVAQKRWCYAMQQGGRLAGVVGGVGGGGERREGEGSPAAAASTLQRASPDVCGPEIQT